MTELDQVIAEAFARQGEQSSVNQVHLLFLKSTLFLPVDKEPVPTDEEPFRPLFAEFEQRIFMLVFDTLDRFTDWAGEQVGQLAYVEITGRDIIAGVGEDVYLVLNAGTEYCKEFSPDEIKYLKKIVTRIDEMKE